MCFIVLVLNCRKNVNCLLFVMKFNFNTNKSHSPLYFVLEDSGLFVYPQRELLLPIRFSGAFFLSREKHFAAKNTLQRNLILL